MLLVPLWKMEATFIDKRVVDALSISNDYIEKEKQRQIARNKKKSSCL